MERLAKTAQLFRVLPDDGGLLFQREFVAPEGSTDNTWLAQVGDAAVALARETGAEIAAHVDGRPLASVEPPAPAPNWDDDREIWSR